MKTKRIILRVTPKQHKELVAAATQKHLTLSEYIRRTLANKLPPTDTETETEEF